MLGSNPNVYRSYSGKTGRVPFCREAEFIQDFHKGEIYFIKGKFRREKVFNGKYFCHLANISLLFLDKKFFLRYNKYV